MFSNVLLYRSPKLPVIHYQSLITKRLKCSCVCVLTVGQVSQVLDHPINQFRQRSLSVTYRHSQYRHHRPNRPVPLDGNPETFTPNSWSSPTQLIDTPPFAECALLSNVYPLTLSLLPLTLKVCPNTFHQLSFLSFPVLVHGDDMSGALVLWKKDVMFSD